MPRRPRSLYEGIYHLAARGSDTRYLFVSDRDREDFLARLATTCERFQLGLLSYVLMGHPSYEVTAGTVTFKGVDLLELEPDERSRLGMFLAFQYPHAVPGVTVSFWSWFPLRQAT